ncbi:Retrovirus-related Pol polyprotein from transposon 17.6 [Anthophora plagiata]
MPIVEEQLASLSGNTYFTTLDLMSGYYQVPVEEESRKYMAFSTHDGHYEFNSMPFGLVNAPSVFQRMINEIIGQMRPGEAIAYLDDIITPSRTVQQECDRFERLLQVLRGAGLTLRPNKCVFFATRLRFLGHEVDGNGIRPGEAKVACIRNFPCPNDVPSVRRFLGLCGFFRKFIKDFAQVSQPLTKLLKTKNGPHFTWTAEQNEAVDRLKMLLCSEPILALYDPNREHELHTDASSEGLAGILLQRDDEGGLRVAYYYSRQCTEAEKLYHNFELEVLAIVESLERFRVYLLGKHFRIVTDCSGVSSSKNTKPLIPRIPRWFLKLQEYDFELVHRTADKIPHADSLSRAPYEEPK